MIKYRPRYAALSVLCLTAVMAGAAPPRIRDVGIEPPFFNPSAGQSTRITFQAAAKGVAKVSILDRDRYPVRTLTPREVAPGLATFTWDGRDDNGALVPDEAWNIRIELGGETYDPSLNFHPAVEDPQPRIYSAVSGMLSYRLARPSRVHIEAGQATLNRKSGRNEGPILKTIANREPRVAGAVVEKWSGFDESGTIRVCDLPNFVVSVLATSLPDNSIITRGNRREAFLDYAKHRRPANALQPKKRTQPTHHHVGLDAFEDRSPDLRITPSAKWNATERVYTAAGDVRMELKIEGGSAAHFLAQPARMSVYVNEKKIATRTSPSSPFTLSIPASELPPGEHRIAVNWGSDFGPAAVGSFRLNVPKRMAQARSEVTR